MKTPGLVDSVQRAWEDLAHPAARFSTGPDLRAAVAPDSLLCPPGWCGVLTIAGATLATAPDLSQAGALDGALAHLSPEQRTDPVVVCDALPVVDVLGPAQLAYLPVPLPPARPTSADRLDVTAGDAPQVLELLAACSADDVAESGMDEITSPAFLLTRRGGPLAVAGYRHWPGDVAHLSVLTRPASRGAGLASVVASVAGDHAARAGLLCQWRARPAASVRVAQVLGYQVLGRQLSLRLVPDPPAGRRRTPSGGARVPRAGGWWSVSENTTPSNDDTVDVFDNVEVRQVQDEGTSQNARAAGGGPLPSPARDPQDPFGQQDDVADGTGQGDPTAGVRISEEDLRDAVPGDEGPEHPGTR